MPFWKVFYWAWSDGFVPPFRHTDVNMPLACWQGVSGLAYKKRVPQSAYFTAPWQPTSFKETWLLSNAYRFTSSQLKKTSNVVGVLSIPMLKKGRHGGSPSYTAVGVITLDACTAEASKFLQENEADLVKYFADIGLLLASLDI
jgi:hypothetical protein